MSHFKKLFLAVLVAGFVLGPAPSQAQTSTAGIEALIATLQTQIADLQSKLAALKQAQSAASTASAQVADTAKLLRSLREGMSGNDVKTLQAILAKYPDIYPESLITGFYGPATVRAVKRFQEREKVVAIGLVGPQTLAKLLKELEKDPVGHEGDEENDRGIKRPCAIVPPGHLIAPGWLRKHDGVHPIVPPCQKLPPGVENILKDRKGTTTPDTIAPVISGMTAGNITTMSARITWITNEPANGKVLYVTSPIAGATTTPSSVSSTEFIKEHAFTLTGLLADTTYYYYVQSSDKSDNTATSSQLTFKTLVAGDTTSPVISSVSATGSTATSTRITWATNENANSKVWYSVTSPVSPASGTPAVSDASFVMSHDLLLTGLAASTTHYFIVESSDTAGNKTLSAQQSFTTLTVVDVTPPVISAVSATSISGSSVHIAWATDELSDSTVWYSTSTPMGTTANASFVFSGTLVSSHDLTLSGLATSTQYYYIAGSKDAAGNSATSAQYSFTTAP